MPPRAPGGLDEGLEALGAQGSPSSAARRRGATSLHRQAATRALQLRAGRKREGRRSRRARRRDERIDARRDTFAASSGRRRGGAHGDDVPASMRPAPRAIGVELAVGLRDAIEAESSWFQVIAAVHRAMAATRAAATSAPALEGAGPPCRTASRIPIAETSRMRNPAGSSAGRTSASPRRRPPARRWQRRRAARGLAAPRRAARKAREEVSTPRRIVGQKRCIHARSPPRRRRPLTKSRSSSPLPRR